MLGFLLLVATFLVLAGAFVLSRMFVGKLVGAPGLRAAFAGDPHAWARVSVGKRLAFAVVGPVACYLVVAFFAATGAWIGGRVVVDETSMRVKVLHGGPADLAGIRDGDRIVAVDGDPTPDWPTLKKTVASKEGDMTVTVERGAERLDLRATPTGRPPKILVGPHAEHASVGVGEGIVEGLAHPVRVNMSVTRGFLRMVTGSEKPELSGPVGITREIDAARDANRRPVADALKLGASLGAYELWVPFVLAIGLFPRRANRGPRPRA